MMGQQALVFLIAERGQLVLTYTPPKFTNPPTEVLIRKGKCSSSLKVKVTLRKRTGKIPGRLVSSRHFDSELTLFTFTEDLGSQV